MFYKLTDSEGYTRKGKSNQLLWGEGITHAAVGNGSELCSDAFIHVYAHPLIAAFMNPIHADFKNPLLWECEVEGDAVHDGQLKSGFKTVKTIRRIDLPTITTEQRVSIGIRCALKHCNEPAFIKWANAWLDGSDRAEAAAWAAAEWAAGAARAAEAAEAAAWAAAAAEWAAEAAARAAGAARAAAEAAARRRSAAAEAAAWAAAARAAEAFDLLAIIKSVVQ